MKIKEIKLACPGLKSDLAEVDTSELICGIV